MTSAILTQPGRPKIDKDLSAREIERQVNAVIGWPALRLLTWAFLLAWAVPVATILTVGALVGGPAGGQSLDRVLRTYGWVVGGAGLAAWFIGWRVLRRVLRRLTQAEVKLEHHEAMKAASIANVAYELRSPLAAVQVSLKNLADGLMGTLTAPQLKTVRDCHEVVGRLTRLASDLIDITGYGKAQPQLQRQEIVLQEVLREIVARAEETLRAHTLTVSLRLPERPVALLGDRAKLTQAFEALLDHAVRWSWTGSTISVELQQVPVGWQLAIAHDVASDKSDFARTLDTFRRLGGDPGQIGLGLQLAHDIVELHLGQFWMEGEPARNNRIMIILPSLARQRAGDGAPA